MGERKREQFVATISPSKTHMDRLAKLQMILLQIIKVCLHRRVDTSGLDRKNEHGLMFQLGE